MNPQNVSAFYRSVPVRDALGFSYKNHLCNVLDAELLEAGLDLKSAYLTMSRIVGHVISNCDALNKECPPNTRTLFETTVVPLRNRGSYSDFTVNMERKALQRYWYQESKKLEHWAKQNNIPEFYHAPTEAPKGYGL